MSVRRSIDLHALCGFVASSVVSSRRLYLAIPFSMILAAGYSSASADEIDTLIDCTASVNAMSALQPQLLELGYDVTPEMVNSTNELADVYMSKSYKFIKALPEKEESRAFNRVLDGIEEKTNYYISVLNEEGMNKMYEIYSPRELGCKDFIK